MTYTEFLEVKQNEQTFIQWSVVSFRKVNHSVADVGSIIGGNVGKNITGGYFQNACPIRMSYVLNATGFPIARNSPYAKVSGADNKFYIYRVNDMIDYLTHTMGKPDLIVNNPKQSDFIGKKGIIVVKGMAGAMPEDTLHYGMAVSVQISATY